MRILVTGATGYIGSRLVPRLVEDGHQVHVLTRSIERVALRPWSDDVTVHVGDVRDRGDLADAFDGVEAAVYLVHGMGDRGDFEAAERRGATTFAASAFLADVQHVVYLGGIVPEGDGVELSPHLRSRVATGTSLADAGPPVTELRASIVIGAGSASFEMIRTCGELAVLLARPTWTRRRCQPIAIADVVDVLARTTTGGPPDEQHRVVEVAGPDAVEYAELVQRYRGAQDLPRLPVVDVPGIPSLAAGLAAGAVMRVPDSIVRPLVGSLAHDTVVAGRHPEWIGPTTLDAAMQAAVAGEGLAGPMAGDPGWAGDPESLADAIRWRATTLPGDMTRTAQALLRTLGVAS